MTSPRGHRVVEHTADEILEAWGPTRAACLEEAVAGFVALFTDRAPSTPAEASTPAETMTVVLDGTDDALLLLDLLDEVLFLADVGHGVPVDVAIVEGDGLVRVTFTTAPITTLTGPAPKGISHSGLSLDRQGDRWLARALVDV